MRATILILLLLFPSSGAARASEPIANNTPETQEDSHHLAQLANCRAGITDVAARPQDRKRWIETLLAFDTPQARQLVVELLESSENPAAQEDLCRVIAQFARTTPERLATAFIDPLLRLLDSEKDGLRAAAVDALADFPGSEVSARLCGLAARPDITIVKRLAAIDALASKADHREVIGELMTLLDAGVPEITDRVVTVLEPMCRQGFGADVDRWKKWWAEKSQLSEERWLADQLQIHRDRHRSLAEAFTAYRDSAEQQRAALANRLGEFQREVFRTTNNEQERAAKLAAWLDDPLVQVKRAALGIIRARIGDEGKRPTGEVLAALLRLLKEGEPAIRRETLLIVQTLNDPAVVDAVLEQLRNESDGAMRHAVLRAIGRLNDPKAIPALVREIANPSAPPECLHEAAVALGQVAAQSQDRSELAAAVPALKKRYESLGNGDFTGRAALLAAMAGIGDASFAPEFLAALGSEEVRLLRPAIRGFSAIGDQSQLPRLRTLMSHGDPLVRLDAVDAIGAFGSEDADLESVLTRLSPTVEPNDAVREAAWNAFRQVAGRKPLAERIESSERLREMPELEETYLLELSAGLPPSNGHGPELAAIQDRLATVLTGRGKYGEAVSHLRNLYESSVANRRSGAADIGMRWLEAVLRSPGEPPIAETVERLASDGDESVRGRVVACIAGYAATLQGPQDADRIRALLTSLRKVPSNPFGEDWEALLDDTESRLTATDPVEAPSTP